MDQPIAAGSVTAERCANRLALWAALMQLLVGISWIAYAAYLPQLLESVGISARRALWVLLADQILFVLFDWLAGSQSDRIARRRGAVGHWLTVAATCSALLLLLLPWAAATGSPVLFLAVALFWTTSSSVMRAPVLAMLGRLGSPRAQSKVVAFALSGLGLAAAFAPFLAPLFKDFSPYWPLGLTALTLVAASAFAAKIEPMSAALTVANDKPDKPQQSWKPSIELIWIGGLMAFAATGMQLLTSELSAPTYRQLGAAPMMLWLPIFWASFFASQPLCKRLIDRDNGFVYPAGALLLTTVALLAARGAERLPVFALSQCVAGASWGLLLASALAYATRVAGPQNTGTAAGIIFSMLALANVFRLTLLALGLDIAASLYWWPALVWLITGLLLLVWRRGLRR